MSARSAAAGMDAGAVSTKAVILERGSPVAHSIIPTGPDIAGAARKCLAAALSAARLGGVEIRRTAATGYGRKMIPSDDVVTEISCHARGALHCFPDTRTVIDIGGQDTKVIFLEDGAVRDFVMNDRCAAGTGRFLEVMARALEIPLEKMGDACLSARRKGPLRLRISSTCTVFAESEAVSLLAGSEPRDEIVRALHEAVAERVAAMTHRYPLGDAVTVTGGVAKNRGVVACLEDRLGARIRVPDEPQIIGALGAALYAEERARAA